MNTQLKMAIENNILTNNKQKDVILSIIKKKKCIPTMMLSENIIYDFVIPDKERREVYERPFDKYYYYLQFWALA